MNTSGRYTLGFDVGKVIIPGANEIFTPDFLDIPPMAGSFDTIHRAVASFDSRHVFLLSRCSLGMQYKILAWLDHYDFYRKTRMRKDKVFFCRERRHKASICKGLGATGFVDDRLEVLSYFVLNRVAKGGLFLFSPAKGEVEVFSQYRSSVHIVQDWDELWRKKLACIPPNPLW